MIIGLENNEKCVYIVDERTKNEIIEAFKKANIDIEKHIKSKQFVFLTKRQAYLKNGYFDPDRMIKVLRQTERLALKEGYNGLRATGEMSWSFTKLPGVERLIEYEAKLNNFYPKSKCIGICQYNEKKFNAEILLDVIHTHPKVIIHQSVCDNPFFIPCFEFIARMEGKIPKGIYRRIKDEIIERKKFQKDRKKADERLQYQAQLIANVDDAIIASDKNFVFNFWNPAAERTYGWKAEEVFGRIWEDVLHTEFIGTDRSKVIQQLIKTGQFSGEMIQCRKDGKPVYVYGKAIALKDRKGQFTGYVSVNRDITEWKKMEVKLRQREQEFKALVENAPDVISRFDKKFRHVYINPAVEREAGMPPKAIIGKTNRELGTPENLVTKWRKAIKSVFETGQEITIETKYPTPSGIKYYSNRVSPEFSEDGSVKTVLNISRNITERKKAEEALRKAHNELEDRVQERTKELEKMKKKIEEYAKRLEIKVSRLQKQKVKLTENEKRVFYSLVKWPDKNDIELSKKTGIKRSTITVIKNKLLKKKWISTVYIPNFLGIGCQLIGISYGRTSYSEFARKFKVMKSEFKIPEVVLMFSTNENFVSIAFFKNFIDTQTFEPSFGNAFDSNNQKRVYIFPLELSKTYKFMDFSKGIRDVFELDYQSNGEFSFPSKNLNQLSNKEKKILYALVKYPSMKSRKLSTLLKISVPTLTKTKKKLIKEGFVKRSLIPNVKKLNQPLLLLHARFNQDKDSDTIEESKRKISDIINEFIRVDVRNQVIMLGIFNDFYAEKDAKLHELLELLHKMEYLVYYPEITVLPAKSIRLQKMDFASIAKKVLDIETEIQVV